MWIFKRFFKVPQEVLFVFAPRVRSFRRNRTELIIIISPGVHLEGHKPRKATTVVLLLTVGRHKPIVILLLCICSCGRNEGEENDKSSFAAAAAGWATGNFIQRLMNTYKVTPISLLFSLYNHNYYCGNQLCVFSFGRWVTQSTIAKQKLSPRSRPKFIQRRRRQHDNNKTTARQKVNQWLSVAEKCNKIMGTVDKLQNNCRCCCTTRKVYVGLQISNVHLKENCQEPRVKLSSDKGGRADLESF